MALATTCPQCKTSFKVVPDQLKLRRGMVRCGMCQHVFSGIDFLRYVDDGPKSGAARGAASGTTAVAGSMPAPTSPMPAAPIAGSGGDDGLNPVTQSDIKTAFFLPENVFDPTTQIDDSELPTNPPTAMVPTSLQRRPSHEPAQPLDATSATDARASQDLPTAAPSLQHEATQAVTPASQPAPEPASKTSERDSGYGADLDALLAADADLLAYPASAPASAADDVGSASIGALSTGALRDDASDAIGDPTEDLDRALDALPPFGREQLEVPADDASTDDASASTELQAQSQSLVESQGQLQASAHTDSHADSHADSQIDAHAGRALIDDDETRLRELGLAPDSRLVDAGSDEWRSLNATDSLAREVDAATALTNTPLPAISAEAAESPAALDVIGATETTGPTLGSRAVGAADNEDAIDYFSSSDQSRRGFSSRLAPLGWVACALLVLLLLLQLGLGGRSVLAGAFPGVQAWLADNLAAMNLKISAPRDVASLTIESFELQTSSTPGVLTMTALLRNRAAYPVQWPALELSLTDGVGTLLVRKVILPEDYLDGVDGTADHEAATPIGARAERPLKMAFEARDLVPSGFSVNLFYP